jgi:hypothetical protein
VQSKGLYAVDRDFAEIRPRGFAMEERKEVNEVNIRIRFDTAFFLGLGLALGMLVAFLIPWIIMVVVIVAGA